MLQKEEVSEKLEKGWIKVWSMFEVLATKQETTKQTIDTLINKLENDPRAGVYKKNISEIKEVEKPMKNIDIGYSITAEVEFVTKKFDNLVQLVIEYGPSAIEVYEPKNLNISCGEAQSILNSISQMMHQFAAAGLGGIVFLKEK